MAIIDNLVSYWKMDEASGNALDAHGSNTLTDTNTVTSGTGKISGGRQFTAANTERFELTSNADVSKSDEDFTFACWVKFDSLAAARTIISKYLSSGLREYMLDYAVFNANRFTWGVSSTGSNYTTVVANNFGTASTGTWYHVVVWHDSVSNLIGISVNDGTPNTTSTSAGVFAGAQAFKIGAWALANAPMDGIIDEVGLWDRVLTSTERTDLYNSGNGLAYPFSVSGQTLEPPLIASTTALYAPTVTPGAVAVSPPLIASTATVYAPTVTPGAVSLAPPLIASTVALYEPAVTPGAVTLEVPLIASTTALYGPTVTPGSVSLVVPLIASTTALHTPTITTGDMLAPPLIASAATLYAPTVTPGGVTLSPPLIASTVVLYAPTVTVVGVTLSPPLIASAEQLFGPTLTPGAVTLTAPLIDSGSALYTPTLSGGGVALTAIRAAASDTALVGATASDSEG